MYVKGRFGQHRFTGQHWPTKLASNIGCPRMMRVARFHESNQEPRIHNGIHLREYPLREERSGGPSLKIPTYLLQA